jgi:hypothetical protein
MCPISALSRRSGKSGARHRVEIFWHNRITSYVMHASRLSAWKMLVPHACIVSSAVCLERGGGVIYNQENSSEMDRCVD